MLMNERSTVLHLFKLNILDVTRAIGWQTQSEWWLGSQQGLLLATQQLLMGCENIQTMCSITDSCRKPLHTPCSSSSSGTHNTNPPFIFLIAHLHLLGYRQSIYLLSHWTLKDVIIDYEGRPTNNTLCEPGLHIIVANYVFASKV